MPLVEPRPCFSFYARLGEKSGEIISLRTKLIVGLATLFVAGIAFADIQHIVVFGYKASVLAERKAEIATRFLALKDLAKRNGKTYIVSINGGTAISKEGFDQGLEQAFIVIFKNESDRNYFVGKPYSDTMDPAHEALAKVVVPLVGADSTGKSTGLFVFDFSDDRSAR